MRSPGDPGGGRGEEPSSGQGLRGTKKKTAGPWDLQLHFAVISGNKNRNRSLVTAGAGGRGSRKKNLRRWCEEAPTGTAAS